MNTRNEIRGNSLVGDIDILPTLEAIEYYTQKIDNRKVDGLLGTNNSLAYKVHEIEKHFHSSEYWFGNAGGNTMSRDNNLTAWGLTAGVAGVYGTAIRLSSADDFLDAMSTAVKMDLHEISVTESSTNDKNYMIQFWTGTGAFADATFRTETPYRTGNNAQEAQPVEIMCPRFSPAERIWARIKCETGAATLDILIGAHGYIG